MKKILFILLIITPILAHSRSDLIVVYPSQYIEFDFHAANSTTEAQLFTALYEGLFNLNPRTMRPQPAAAERYTVSEDGLTYTFFIRQGLAFSDGSPLNAHSFYHSFLRLLNPAADHLTAAKLDVIEGAKAYRLGEAGLDGLAIKVVDNHELQLTLNEVTPHFTALLTHHAFSPISGRQLPMLWDEPARIAFSGPYTITTITEDSIIMERNPFYRAPGEVLTARIIVRFSDDRERIAADFNRFLVDWVMPGSFDPNLILERGALQINAMFATTYYFFASDNPLFSNTALRQALVQAIPTNELRANQIIRAESLVPAIQNYPRVRGINHNARAAANALRRLGFRNGANLPELTIATFSENDSNAVAIKEAWQALGLTVSIITPAPSQDYLAFIAESNPTLALMSWVGDFLDPMAFLQLFTSQNPLNFSSFKSAAYDDLLRLANHQSGNERLNTLADAERLLIAGGYVIPIAHPPSINLINPQAVAGWYANPLNIYPFAGLRLAPLPGMPALPVSF
ncbi:MAG: peptide ABC transporter substrate-binding protein [Spirochaetaceae bacterium]|nr:peptide ABC transporter substrate-binding protein [Spirochaetaceae bacterium]